jgi:glycosyltransferase involved in cell wall biosynthesis
MTSNNPKISVIMSVYNGGKYLREAIESILAQSFTDFEFIIVNDGSTDNSLEIIQSYDDERIKIINNEKNLGLTKSLNKALKKARGEYIARQDADDISLPNRFEEQMKYFERYPETVVLGTSIYVINGAGKLLMKEIAPSDPSKILLNTNAFTHGSVIFKKAVVDELGYYNELLKYSQDYELWSRIAKHYKVCNLTQPLYKLRSHKENIRIANFEEGLLYHFLVQNTNTNKLSVDALDKIKTRGIFELYPYLDKQDKFIFHRTLGHKYARDNNLRLAREEYKKVFKLNPFNIKNILHILLSFFGGNVIKRIHEIHALIHSTVKNYFSRQ